MAARRVDELDRAAVRSGVLVGVLGAIAFGRRRPAERRRSGRALRLAEREEVSIGLVAGRSPRAIAVELGRAPSTISREVGRNGGRDRYRVTRSDQAAWERALRPKLADHRRFTLATEVDVYFCDPQSPWQRGPNENTNRLLRQYLPHGIDLSTFSQAQLSAIARQLTSGPERP